VTVERRALVELMAEVMGDALGGVPADFYRTTAEDVADAITAAGWAVIDPRAAVAALVGRPVTPDELIGLALTGGPTEPWVNDADRDEVAAEAGHTITATLGRNGTPARCSCGFVEDLDDRDAGRDTVAEHLTQVAAAHLIRDRPPSTVDGPPSTTEATGP
jgi:hypothetical protein